MWAWESNNLAGKIIKILNIICNMVNLMRKDEERN